MQSVPTTHSSLRPQDVLRLEDTVALVVGDIMLDSYLAGSVERVSPEAPVPVLHARHERTVLGGAANVAAGVIGLGGQAILIGVFGDDGRGRQLERLCADAGVDLRRELRRPTGSTTIKQRVVSGTQQLLRIDWERHDPTTPSELGDIRATLPGLIRSRGVNCIVLSDYAKGTITSDVARLLIDAGKQASIPVIVDPKGPDLTRYAGADVIKPNIAEARTYAALPTGATDTEIAQVLHRATHASNFVISMASEGVAIHPAVGSVTRFKSQVVEVADVSGAGDTMIATLASGLAAGFSITEAVEIGNIAAGLACTHFGTHVVSAAELIPILAQRDRSADSPHVLRNWAALKEIVDVHRRAGARIVFANGCFDLLHGGHVALLAEARDQGDLLIVGLNSDDSVRRLKGPARPLQSIDDRLRVMAAVRFVDYVTEFAEDTPLELIMAIRPDIIVKGGDYRPEEVVGFAESKEWNGRIHIAKLIEGLSTTGLVTGDLGSGRKD